MFQYRFEHEESVGSVLSHKIIRCNVSQCTGTTERKVDKCGFSSSGHTFKNTSHLK